MGREPNKIPEEGRWLRWSVAFVWLATGLSVLHPDYREVGHDAGCAGTVVLWRRAWAR
jgi:hypothetical protein